VSRAIAEWKLIAFDAEGPYPLTAPVEETPRGDHAEARGSSGAPLIYTHRGFNIIGVLKSNAQYHLLPAEVTMALKADNTMIDEVSYFLPQGIAVNIGHLREMYERVVER
jgi:hypothetical protein